MNLIDCKTLNEKITNQAAVVLLDVRFDLVDVNYGKNAYEKGHLPGAHYLHIDKDLSGKKKKHGGNHPLPNPNELSEKLANIGVSNDTTVVIYDEDNGMFSARTWWLLYYLGHDNTYILEGGFNEWVRHGFDVTKVRPKKKKGHFTPKVQYNLTVNIQELKEALKNENIYLIDSRAKERYLGKTESLYTKAGHIPGALNYFWKDVYSNNYFKSKEQLKEHFKRFDQQDEIIVSCGSGISACANFFALKRAGFENVKLYPGSFSDWISYEENEVVTREE